MFLLDSLESDFHTEIAAPLYSQLCGLGKIIG